MRIGVAFQVGSGEQALVKEVSHLPCSSVILDGNRRPASIHHIVRHITIEVGTETIHAVFEHLGKFNAGVERPEFNHDVVNVGVSVCSGYTRGDDTSSQPLGESGNCHPIDEASVGVELDDGLIQHLERKGFDTRNLGVGVIGVAFSMSDVNQERFTSDHDVITSFLEIEISRIKGLEVRITAGPTDSFRFRARWSLLNASAIVVGNKAIHASTGSTCCSLFHEALLIGTTLVHQAIAGNSNHAFHATAIGVHHEALLAEAFGGGGSSSRDTHLIVTTIAILYSGLRGATCPQGSAPRLEEDG